MPLTKEHQVHRHLAERNDGAHCFDGDPCVGAVEGHRGDEPETQAPGIAPDRKRAILMIEAAENIAVALQEPLAQPEEFDLLGVVLTGKHRLEVQLHARLGRAPAKEAKGIARELGFSQKCRQAREHQHDDCPRREAREQNREAHDRHGVLRETEGAHHER